jgi:purine catabolism regulator
MGGSAVSVADALRLALPSGTRVVHGQAQLQQSIHWARAFISRPWAISGLEDAALVLLAVRGLSRTELQTLPRLIDALILSNVAAVALNDDSPDIIEAASRDEGLPILVLPQNASLQDVERSVIGLILDRNGQVQRRAGEIYQLLIQRALEDAPVQTMVEVLAEAAGRAVFLEDEYGVLQAVASAVDANGRGLPSAIEAPALYSAREVLGISTGAPATAGQTTSCIRRILSNEAYTVYSSPISFGGTVAGFLTLLGRTAEMQDLDEEIVERGASAFAFPIAKQRAIVETQTRLQGSFLENLFAGTINDEDEIAARARYLGHNLRDAYLTACLTLDEPKNGRSALDERQRAGLWSSFVDLARREFLERWPRALLRERGDVLAVLLPVEAALVDDDAGPAFESLRVRLGRLVGETTATVGLGRRTAGPREIVRSYAEAEQAARIATQFLGGNRTATFEELGVYRVIAKVEDRGTLEAFRREYLGPLEEYDARHAAELVETLEGFFACNGNHARAAEMLHLHRNTLLYRLERIEVLTGRDLSDPETRLSMQLALKIRRVFPTMVASPPTQSQGART